MVAPYAGAWIEIVPFSTRKIKSNVAPYAGAWIEIFPHAGPRRFLPSLPTRERGLKFVCVHQHIHIYLVAPYAGAWIEIRQTFHNSHGFESLPTRERGLKFIFCNQHSPRLTSLPTRERGLKFPGCFHLLRRERRSLRGSVD